MIPIRSIQTISSSPSGDYSVVVKRLPNKGDDDFINAEILLLDRKGQTILNLSPTYKRLVKVIWRRDEKAVIVNNIFAIDGDWLVYAQETKPGHWDVKRSSLEYAKATIKNPYSVLNPGRKKYPTFRCKIFGIDFQGQNVVAVMSLYAIRPSTHQRKSQGAILERRYILNNHEITRFPTPHQLKSFEAALQWRV